MRHSTEPNLVCADHRTKLQSRITTDGDGGLVELIEPCRECRRPRITQKLRPGTLTLLLCQRCNETFTVPYEPGPQPTRCEACGQPGNGRPAGRPVGTVAGANAERDAEMRRRKAAGESAPSLAAAFGMTTQRVYQICRGIRRG